MAKEKSQCATLKRPPWGFLEEYVAGSKEARCCDLREMSRGPR